MAFFYIFFFLLDQEKETKRNQDAANPTRPSAISKKI